MALLDYWNEYPPEHELMLAGWFKPDEKRKKGKQESKYSADVDRRLLGSIAGGLGDARPLSEAPAHIRQMIEKAKAAGDIKPQERVKAKAAGDIKPQERGNG